MVLDFVFYLYTGGGTSYNWQQYFTFTLKIFTMYHLAKLKAAKEANLYRKVA